VTAVGHQIVTLSDAQLAYLAEQVVERLRPTGAPARQQVRLVDAATLAGALGISRDCVYTHTSELGGKRIGSGPRGRLRFDLDSALSAWTSRCHSKESHRSGSPAPTSHSASPQRQRVGSSVGLLPIKGSATFADTRRGRP
jgi:hypothetical protein